MDKLSYSLGLGIGRQLLQLGAKDLNVDDFAQSIRDILAGKKPAVSDEEAQQIVNNFFREQEEKKATEAKAEGENFLKENAAKEGVITLPSGLQYKVLREGNGKKPTAADVVECDYEGTLIMVRSSTPATAGESTLHSPSTRLLKDGQRVCSS